MSYWQDIFDTYQAAQADEQPEATPQGRGAKKTPYVVVQIALPLEDAQQLSDLDSLQKLFEKILEKGMPPDISAESDDSSEE